MRMNNIRNASLCALGTTLIALVLPACTKSDGFTLADTDKSGSVSRPEFDRYLLESIFAQADANRDKKVTFAEWHVANPDANQEKFNAPDKNKDGSVTPEEAQAFMESKGTLADLFSKIDSDKSGSVSKGEAIAFRNKLAQQSGTTPIQSLIQSTAQ